MLQQFRIANGEKLDITEDPDAARPLDRVPDQRRGRRPRLPARPGPVTKFKPPTGPGVRLDSGVETGSVIGGQFDSMLAKLIVTGATARRRWRGPAARSPSSTSRAWPPSSRSTAPWSSDPAFIGDDDGFTVHTRWIETEWDNNVEPFTGGDPLEEDDTVPRQTVVVEVGGRRLEVSLPGDLASAVAAARRRGGVIRKKPKPRKRGAHGGAAASGDAVTAPMQGTVVKVAVEEGQEVAAGDLVVVLEAMKMENPVTAHKDGTMTGLAVEAGAAITQGTVLAEIK